MPWQTLTTSAGVLHVSKLQGSRSSIPAYRTTSLHPLLVSSPPLNLSLSYFHIWLGGWLGCFNYSTREESLLW